MKKQEQILVEACQRNDRKAQFQLFDLYLPYVTVVVRRYLLDQNAVSDLSQEIFITVFKNLKSSYDSTKGDFKPWLRKIAIRKCFRYNKSNSAFQGIDDDTPVISIEPSVFNNFSEEELMKLIQLMPEQYRPVFNLVAIDGYSHPEVSEMLGITATASRKKLSRARSWLSQRIQSSSSLSNTL